MNRLRCQKFILLLLVIFFFSCSLAPKKKITIGQLNGNDDLGRYDIESGMNDVLESLNKRGEVVVFAKSYGTPVYLQIFYGRDGLTVRQYDKEEYGFYEE